jgi:hypothetical protein
MSRYKQRRTRHDNGDASVHYEETSEELTADHTIFASADSLWLTQLAINVGAKKRRIEPSDLEDPYANWDPVPEGDQGWTEEEAGEELEGDEEGEVDPVTGAKRKRYQSSVSRYLSFFGKLGEDLRITG